jgi:outer membrane protein TolC
MFGTWPKNHCAGAFLLIVLATWICTSNSAHTQPAATPQKDKDKAAEIKTLLKERRETLQTIVDSYLDLLKTGRGSFEPVLQAKREALRATLEIDEAPEVRLAALKDYLETAKASLNLAEDGFKLRRISVVEVLKAKAIMLEAQIELLREESKTKQGK